MVTMSSLNIAVVGSGIAGLSAAWLLSKHHRVTLFEQERRLGGHTNTVDVDTVDGPVAVDTGFIVYNERTYPNLIALLEHLNVQTEPTEMTFAVSVDRGSFEYAGSPLGFFGQLSNLWNPGQWSLMFDLFRFFRTSQKNLKSYPAGILLGDFLAAEKYSHAFIEDHILPMGAAIWSTPMVGMLNFPARAFVDFYANHGMLQTVGRPGWRTVTGGSRNYVTRLCDDGNFETVSGAAIRRIRRTETCVHMEDEHGIVRFFDHVVVASHADQALAMLADANEEENALLAAFRYERNRTFLHRDKRFMPRRRRLWQSWNYMKQERGLDSALCVTYWMNRLQNLPTTSDLFVTLNPPFDIHPKAIDLEITYEHPVFSNDAYEAQQKLWSLQGKNRTWFCGSYFGYGFHEDGLQSGLSVAEQLGGHKRPWRVANDSGRIYLSAMPEETRAIGLEAAE